MRTVLVILVAAALIAVACVAQQIGNGPATRPAGVLSLPHLTVDVAEGRIVVPAKVCLRRDLLELLLCHVNTKEHETILHTLARPSDLHAALLAIGLTPGKPARWTQVEDEPGRIIPPRGPSLTVRLRWTDAEGRLQEADASQWLSPVGPEKTDPPEAWVFVGSDLLGDDSYWADSSGEMVSVSNFPSSVIDVPFPSNEKGPLLFAANTDVIPPVGTDVEVIIAAGPEAAAADHARGWVFVDRFGRVRIGDRVVSLAEAEAWAQDFIVQHAQGQVVVRADPRAMGYHVQEASDAMRIGGVWDILETRSYVHDPVLPRTAERAEAELDALRATLAEGGIFGDPRGHARATLNRIDKEIEELKRLEALWREYDAHIRQILADAPAADEEP